jgi:hypothetical protein
MLGNSSKSDKHFYDNPPEFHLRTFTALLMDGGYADVTVQSKLCLIADFGHWLDRSALSVTNLDERRVEAFVNDKQRVRRGDLEMLKQFLDHLRKRDVVPARKLVPDKSSCTDILS